MPVTRSGPAEDDSPTTLADDIAARRRAWIDRQARRRLPVYEPHGWTEANWDVYGDILAEDHTRAVGAGIEEPCGAPWCVCVHLPRPDVPPAAVPHYLTPMT